jgi:hypothetical protein
VATLTFDKLAYVDRLKAAGMGEREARALAEDLDQALRKLPQSPISQQSRRI